MLVLCFIYLSQIVGKGFPNKGGFHMPTHSHDPLIYLGILLEKMLYLGVFLCYDLQNVVVKFRNCRILLF